MGNGNSVLKNALYATILDVSFARTGGCIAAINLAHTGKIIVDGGAGNNSIVKKSDVLRDPSSLKANAIHRLIQNKKFHELDRAIRKELVGIDGATIVDNSGNILAIGAIIKIDGGSTGGGRLAATKTLAPYGIAIKISADGMIKAFIDDEGNVKTVFEI